MDARPFASVDELIKVKGIGPTTLSKIKFQNLACVNEVESKDAEEENNTETEETNNEDEENETPKVYAQKEESKSSQTGNVVQETIQLNPSNSKDIKTKTENSFDTKRYATYGFVAFLVFLALLFILKRNNSKNEII